MNKKLTQVELFRALLSGKIIYSKESNQRILFVGDELLNIDGHVSDGIVKKLNPNTTYSVIDPDKNAFEDVKRFRHSRLKYKEQEWINE